MTDVFLVGEGTGVFAEGARDYRLLVELDHILALKLARIKGLYLAQWATSRFRYGSLPLPYL